jgi:hypothetical protein
MVAEIGPPRVTTPTLISPDTPKRAVAETVEPLVSSSPRVSCRTSTKGLSDPLIATPKVMAPADCIVSRLSWMRTPDFDNASIIWVARTKPSVSFEYDLTATRRLANPFKEDSEEICSLLNRRGVMAACNRRLEAASSSASFSNCAVRSFASAACLWASLAWRFNMAIPDWRAASILLLIGRATYSPANSPATPIATKNAATNLPVSIKEMSVESSTEKPPYDLLTDALAWLWIILRPRRQRY